MNLQRRLVALAAVAAVAAVATGCSAPPEPSAGGCPAEGWEAAVFWSTETGASSQIAFVRGAQVVARQALPYLGLEASPTDGTFREGVHVWLKSNGNTTRDRTHLLRWSTNSCSAEAFRVAEPVVRAVSAGADSFTTTNTLNGTAEVRRRALDGSVLAERRFEGMTLSVLVPHGDRLYALGSTVGRDVDESLLLDLDAASLVERRRTVLTGLLGSPQYAVRHDGTLLYPRTVVPSSQADAGSEGTALGVVRLADLEQSEVDLASPAPYLVRDAGGVLLVGHTYMNPGFRSTDEYRVVTRYTPATGDVEAFEVDSGLLQMTVAGDRLLVLTQSGTEADPRLSTYHLPDMIRLSTVAVPRPDAAGNYYVAGLVTP